MHITSEGHQKVDFASGTWQGISCLFTQVRKTGEGKYVGKKRGQERT